MLVLHTARSSRRANHARGRKTPSLRSRGGVPLLGLSDSGHRRTSPVQAGRSASAITICR
jgi:hypothetical protein